jgi:hypothetical protein
MRTPIALVPLLILASSPVLAEDSAPAGVASAAPAAAVAPAPARPVKTLAGVDRHVAWTVTALMRRLAQSRIPPDTRSQLNQRLLEVQSQSSAAVRAGQPPAGEDLERFSARLAKSLDAIAGAIDSALTRAERPLPARQTAAARP